MKRVVISGENKTGKSELFNELRNRYGQLGVDDIWFIDDFLRTLIKDSSDEYLTIKQNSEIGKLALANIKRNDQRIPPDTKLSISDRGMVDLYVINAACGHIFNNTRMKPFLDTKKYAGAIILEPNSEDKTTEMTTKIIECYRSFNVRHIVLPPFDLTTKANESMTFINSVI